MTIAEKVKPVPYQVTYAAFNRVKFYLDLSGRVGKEISYLENMADFTISKLKTSLQIPQGMVKDIIYDINEGDQIIYFDIILNSFPVELTFIELVSYLSNNKL